MDITKGQLLELEASSLFEFIPLVRVGWCLVENKLGFNYYNLVFQVCDIYIYVFKDGIVYFIIGLGATHHISDGMAASIFFSKLIQHSRKSFSESHIIALLILHSNNRERNVSWVL